MKWERSPLASRIYWWSKGKKLQRRKTLNIYIYINAGSGIVNLQIFDWKGEIQRKINIRYVFSRNLRASRTSPTTHAFIDQKCILPRVLSSKYVCKSRGSVTKISHDDITPSPIFAANMIHYTVHAQLFFSHIHIKENRRVEQQVIRQKRHGDLIASTIVRNRDRG